MRLTFAMGYLFQKVFYFSFQMFIDILNLKNVDGLIERNKMSPRIMISMTMEMIKLHQLHTNQIQL